MLVEVGRMFEAGGRPMPRHRLMTQQGSDIGMLVMVEQYDKQFRRNVMSAYLRAVGTGADVLPPLRDGVVRFVGDWTITISGLETDLDGHCCAQSWFCKIVRPPAV